MGQYEDQFRQQVGMPIQQGAQQLGGMADAGQAAIAQKLQALKDLAMKNASPNPMMPQAPPKAQPDALPNDPSMSPADAQNREASMIAANDNMANVAARLRTQAAAGQAQIDHQNAVEDDPMTGYSDVPNHFQVAAAQQQAQQQRFANLHKKMSTGQVVTKDDIRNHLSPGMHEVTPELEAQLYPPQPPEDDEMQSSNSQMVAKGK